jgi:outer membrane lipoprotein-sorting protein
MKLTILSLLLILMLLAAAVVAQVAIAPAAQPQGKAVAGNLESVLTAMDRAADNFKTAEASFVWDQYSKVVNDHDLQKGTIYYRRASNGVEMASHITSPARKYVLFAGGKMDVYQPEIEQVTEYNAGRNRADFESFLVLGFGGRGHDLQKSFDVRFDGSENVDGVQAAKLTLTPKQVKVRNMFQQIILWIDPARGISVQQQLIEPSGDYRLAKYSNIKINQNIPNDIFKLKTSGKTKWVRPQSE